MITRLGDIIARKLVISGSIPSEDAELYAYGFFLLLSKELYLILISILGAVLGIFWQSILFYLLFSVLREYAGGIHAKTELGCMLSTTLALFLSVGTLRYLVQSQNSVAALVLLSFGFVVIVFLSPLDTPEKPLSSSERQYFQRVSRGIGAAYAILGIGSAIAGWSLLYILAVLEALAGILLLGGFLRERRRDNSFSG